MGCCWSCEDDDSIQRAQSNRLLARHLDRLQSTNTTRSVQSPALYSPSFVYNERVAHGSAPRSPEFHVTRNYEVGSNRQDVFQQNSSLLNRLNTQRASASNIQPTVKIPSRTCETSEIKQLKQRQSRARHVSVTGQKAQSEAKYGEYKCSCGRFWHSRLCWPDKYQKCKHCKKPVFPHTHRELVPSDIRNGDEILPEHDKDLCQMCKELGYSCIIFKRNEKQKRSRSESRVSRKYKNM